MQNGIYWPALSISMIAFLLTSNVELFRAALSLVLSSARLEIEWRNTLLPSTDSSSTTFCWSDSNSLRSSRSFWMAAAISLSRPTWSPLSASIDEVCSSSHFFQASCVRIPSDCCAWICSKLQATLRPFSYLNLSKGNHWVHAPFCRTDSTLNNRSNRLMLS